MRLTLRLRLACLTGLVIVGTGAALLALNYALVRRTLGPSIDSVVVDIVDPAGGTDMPGGVPPADVAGTIPESATKPGSIEATHFATRRDNIVDQLTVLPAELTRLTLREVVTQSAVALGLMSLVAVGVSWFMAGRFLRPIRHLTQTARDLSGSTLHRRIALGGPRDEMTELADTFDEMLGRLEASFDAQSRFVANASHELRTPVAISLAAVDVLDAKTAPTSEQVKATIDKVRLASQRSEALIDGLLLLARSDGQLTELATVDLALIAETVLEELGPRLQSGALVVERHLKSAAVTGDPVLLERVVANLVENALKYNHPGGSVGIHTATTSSGTELVVTNTGRIVAPDQVASLFEPFRRGEDDRISTTGAGLGLSIVASIAKAHGGSAEIEALPGGGLKVTVLFPSAC